MEREIVKIDPLENEDFLSDVNEGVFELHGETYREVGSHTVIYYDLSKGYEDRGYTFRRESDGKFFKLEAVYADSYGLYELGDNVMKEVFKKTKEIIVYE